MIQDEKAKSSTAPGIQMDDEPAGVAPVVTLPPAPPGFCWVFNRLPQNYEKFFDGVPHLFLPHQPRIVSEDAAVFFSRTSLIKLDPFTGEATYALVGQDDPMFNVPYEEDLGDELLDRKTDDNYTGRKAEGPPTKAERVKVKGGEFVDGKRITTNRLSA